jgi:hypothetical protein
MGESIQLCLVVVYECVTTRGGSIQLCLVVVYECVTTRGGRPYSGV